MNDCVFEKGRSCTALRHKECNNCTFRKTKEELIEGRQKALDRVRTLPEIKRLYINIKYYGQRRRYSLEKN